MRTHNEKFLYGSGRLTGLKSENVICCYLKFGADPYGVSISLQRESNGNSISHFDIQQQGQIKKQQVFVAVSHLTSLVLLFVFLNRFRMINIRSWHHLSRKIQMQFFFLFPFISSFDTKND